MKRTLTLVSIAAGLIIVSAAGVVLFRSQPLPSAGLPSSSGRQAVAVIASAPPSAASTPVATATPSASEGKTEGGRKEEPLDWDLWSPAEESVRQRVADRVRSQVPEAVPLFIRRDLPPLTPNDEVLAALWHTLDLAQSAPPAEQPPLLLAADFLADKVDFPPNLPPAPETQKKVDRLAGYGLSFGYAELAGSWIYSHDLLWRIWRDFRDSPWAEDAFVLLLAGGWDPTNGCRRGQDTFRAVIPEGENFLAAHPQSGYRPETSYLVAQAYETWWSLSRAKECQSEGGSGCDEYVTPGLYLEGADQARQKAIDHYELVLRIAPDGKVGANARRHLADLKQSLDTVQRRFYCYVDD